MASDQQPKTMAEGRSLLTERERDILAGNADVKDNYRYKVESYARQRISGVKRDVDVLRENYPELYEELQEIVCNENSE